MSPLRLTADAALVLLLLCLQPVLAYGGANPTDSERAAGILAETGVQGGLIVHLGCGDGKLTVALRGGDGYVVQGLSVDTEQMVKAREYVRSRGAYGVVSVDQFDGLHLPFIDNLVNLIVVEEAYDVSRDELMRVLAPLGVAYVRTDDGWSKTTKPWPDDIDEWTHYMHGPDNNRRRSKDCKAVPCGLYRLRTVVASQVLIWPFHQSLME